VEIEFVFQSCYSESLCTSSPLLRLLCSAVSAASRHAGCPVTQGRTLRNENHSVTRKTTGNLQYIVFRAENFFLRLDFSCRITWILYGGLFSAARSLTTRKSRGRCRLRTLSAEVLTPRCSRTPPLQIHHSAHATHKNRGIVAFNPLAVYQHADKSPSALWRKYEHGLCIM
jgi:hypothetical protein